MWKLATLIMKPIYPHRNQIKTNFETQFQANPMLNGEIGKKKSIKKEHKKWS